jgi:hypothetical protein
MAVGWRKLCNEKLNNPYYSPIIIRVIKSESIRWVGHGRDEKCIQNFSQTP